MSGSETLTSESKTLTDEQMKIALDDRWQTGVYMVVLRSGGRVATKRLVVSRL